MRKNKINTAKLGVMFIVAAMALAGIGAGYSAWFDTIYVEGTVSTGSIEWEVVDVSDTHVYKIHDLPEPTQWGNEIYVDYESLTQQEIQDMFAGYECELISWTEVGVHTNKHEVKVSFDNLFPCIWFKADIVIEYTGTVPGKINDIFYEPTNGIDWITPLIESGDIYATARVGDEVVELGYQLHQGDQIHIELNIHIPQNNALMLQEAGFTASFEVIQWNEYVPPQPPVADANGPYSAFNAITITLDGSGSYDLDGSIILYEWDFEGDGTYDWSSPTSGIVDHTYSGPETYNPILRVTDNDGMTNIDIATVTIDGFSDDFNDNTLDTTKWTETDITGGNYHQETNQEAKFALEHRGHCFLLSKTLTIENWDTITVQGKWKCSSGVITPEMNCYLYDTDASTVIGAAYDNWNDELRLWYTPNKVEIPRISPQTYASFELIITKTNMQYWENGVMIRDIPTTLFASSTHFKLKIGGWDASSVSNQFFYFDDISVTASD